MAAGKRPSSGAGGGRRRRPSPTIELQATEVPAEPAPQEPARPESPPPDPFIPPPPVRPLHAAPDEPSAAQAASPPPRSTPRPDNRPKIAWLPPDFSWPLLGAGAAAAGGVLLAFILLWATGLTSPSREPANALDPRLAAIETRLRELADRPPPLSVDPKAIDQLSVRLGRLETQLAAVADRPPAVAAKALEDLTARLGKLETAVAAQPAPATDPAMLSRLGASDSVLKSLGDNVAALARRTDELNAAIRDTRGRVDGVAAAVTDLQNTARTSAAGSDRAVRLAVAASALRSVVERGEPFAAELAVAQSLASDAAALSALAPFAAAGVPTNALLGQELAALIQPMVRASGATGSAGTASRDGGYLDRLQANAERLVRIRPIDQPAADDPLGALARIEFKAASGDVAGALADLAKLPAATRAPAQPWIAKVAARDRALEASRRFVAEAVAALKTAP